MQIKIFWPPISETRPETYIMPIERLSVVLTSAAMVDGGVVGERLYIPQHPQGWGKKIALYSTEAGDPGHPVIVSKNFGGCQGRPGPDMGYRADTQGGSSGSPVVAYSDHQIIALHHCGSTSINTGVLIEQVIAGLGSNLPASAFADPNLVFADGFEVGNTSGWSQTIQ